MQKNRQRACFGTKKGLYSAQGGDEHTLVKLELGDFCHCLQTTVLY